MKKRLFSLILAVGMIVSLVGCNTPTDNPPPEPITLSTPTDIRVSAEGVVTWSPVENATEYIITVNGKEFTTQTPYFYLDVTQNATFSVIARAENYLDSASSETGTFTKPAITVNIEGGSEIRSGKTLKLRAVVTGVSEKGVTWEVTEGNEFVSVAEDGTVTALEVDGDKTVTVVAKSKADPSVSATKRITVTAKTELTQEMLDELAGDKISFEGFLNISLYEFGISNDFVRSFSSDVKTAMDGTNWYTQYTDTDSGIVSRLYYKNVEGIASQVSVSFMNEESYTPMLDDDDREIHWEAAGLYNNFKTLKASDFTFNETTWRWEYKNTEDGLIERMVASANPYDFDPTNLALIIEDGAIAGIYSKAKPDRTLVPQYEAIKELSVVINAGDSVEVPTISKFKSDPRHEPLKQAIENMQALDSYTVEFLNIEGSTMSSGYTVSGFTETVTADTCYFRPFRQNGYGDDEVIRTYTNEDYGYSKRSETLYNSFSIDGGVFSANRAFRDDFSSAKPSFAFAAEIFTSYYEDESDGTITFYVNETMSAVASTFYMGVGNELALYGLFAAEGNTGEFTFTPFVTVKDGFIIEAGFYYNLGYLYGVVELKYGTFDQTETPASVTAGLAAMEDRQIPLYWSQVDIITTPDSSDTEHMENALEFLQEFFGMEDIETELPFFTAVLGDTYGFGLLDYRVPAGESVTKPTLMLYFDVPLDVNYSLEGSIKAVQRFLLENGFTKNKHDVFRKGDIAVQVVDSSLDLNIYVWKA